MPITGEMLIGASAVRGTQGDIHGIHPATGETLQPAFGGGGAAEVERACALAAAAFDTFRETTPEQRATFLEAAAQAILDLGDELVERAVAESGLPRGRTGAGSRSDHAWRALDPLPADLQRRRRPRLPAAARTRDRLGRTAAQRAGGHHG